MRKASWDSLAPSFEGYVYTEAVGRFIERAARELRPLALILFGSLAKGDYHQHSDADFCVVLAESPRSPFEGYDRVVACDPSGVVQPVVYGAEQFRQMVRQANGLALEVMADGLFLAGDEAFRQEIEQLAAHTRQRLGIERTPTGWRIARPGLIAQVETEQELLRTRLRQASATASTRVAHLTEGEVEELIDRARSKVHQETATP